MHIVIALKRSVDPRVAGKFPFSFGYTPALSRRSKITGNYAECKPSVTTALFARARACKYHF